MLNMFKKKPLDPKAELQAVLGGYELPSFPALIMHALEKVRDENASLSEIAELVAADPGLSARLLKTVNSAAYALNHKVKNIDHAVSLMGRGELESIIITLAVSKVLPVEQGSGIDLRSFWHAAARRAAVARSLADLIDPSSRSESFTAALLQDMAIPVLARQRAEDYGPVLASWRESGTDLAELEREVFDWDHTLVAMWMCDMWDFPERIASAIGAHHGAAADGSQPLPVVSLVAMLREGEPSGMDELVETVHASYGLPHEQLVSLATSSETAADEIARMLI